MVATDPQFSYFMFPFLRLMNRKIHLIHWAFDLYPEAILVNAARWMRLLATLTKPFVPWAYRRIDMMVDIGQCMRERLARYHHGAECATLPPWALVEPGQVAVADPAIRCELFGEAKLGLLYSGTVGHAHDLTPFIKLARECRKRGIDVAFCLAGCGNQFQQQTAVLTAEDTNIKLAGFTTEDELEERLAAADIHLISLRNGWEGVVVPSKFFGALAIGRPVIFAGPESSSIARWCHQYKVGLTMDTQIVDILHSLADSPQEIATLQQHSYQIYKSKFSKKSIFNGWLQLLENIKDK